MRLEAAHLRSMTQSTLVIGAGLIGLTTAQALHARGHAVSVLERNADVGLETSFANGGMLTPSQAGPWNEPGVFWDLLRWLGRSEAPMLLRPGALPAYAGWGLRFLRHSARAAHRRAAVANTALGALSLARLQALRERLGLHYRESAQGTLKVFRDEASWQHAAEQAELLRDVGLNFEVLDRAQLLAAEPSLSEVAAQLVGGVLFPADESGDAHQFCLRLREHLVGQGVRIEHGVAVDRIEMNHAGVQAVHAGSRRFDASRVVVCAAARSAELLGGAGRHLCIRPVKGYSLSIDDAPADLLPSRPLVDEALHAAITPLAGEIRIAGTAEFAGWDARIDPARIDNLWHLLEQVTPTLAARVDRSRARPWCGFRPMAADGRPYIGALMPRGLYLNAGHGHLGWTQCVGSAELLAALIDGEPPPIDPSPYSALRRA